MKEMSSIERVLTAIGHKEADRVPMMLLLSLYGAKELQIPIKEYFSKPENIATAQIAMQKKYRNDCYYTFFYAPIEIEAWGGEVIYVEDGPPNSGQPMITDISQIDSMKVPDINNTKCLLKVLEATRLIKERTDGSVPTIGVVMSPFSLPIMQMGFEKYLQLMYFHKREFERLMTINMEFCISWANAQLAAGATAICYFDPLASPTVIERGTYLKTGYNIAVRTISSINGPTATHLASGISLPVIEDIASTGSAIIGISSKESLAEVKRAASGKICLLGNLNGIDMVNWDAKRAENEVKKVIAKAGAGGGLILSDNHGEIPFQVKEDTLMAISDSVMKWGEYPLNWVGEYAED